jgi:Tfp pilus assembly ATPase PilU
MQTLNHALANLVTGGLVTVEDALKKSSNPVQLEEMLKHRKPSTLDPLAKLFR